MAVSLSLSPHVVSSSAPAALAALGTHAKNVSRHAPWVRRATAPTQEEKRENRFLLQNAARELIPGERVAHCLRRPHGAAIGVDVLHSASSGSAYFSGLQTCASVWACPVCAAKISERRREELKTAVDRWRARGGVLPMNVDQHSVLMLTFTVRHHSGHSLDLLLSGLLDSYRRLCQGQAWMDIKRDHRLVGTIKALEVTYGSNGWHPHLHVLTFHDGHIGLSEFADKLKRRWASRLALIGLDASYDIGLDIQVTANDIGNYISKFGQWTAEAEMTKFTVKQSRAGETDPKGATPLDLLARYALHNDEEAGALWVEYFRAFKGKKQLHWSHNLRKLLLGDDEVDDQQLVDDQADDSTVLASLTKAQWIAVYSHNGVDNRAGLLNIARYGDPEKVKLFLLSACGIDLYGDGW